MVFDYKNAPLVVDFLLIQGLCNFSRHYIQLQFSFNLRGQREGAAKTRVSVFAQDTEAVLD